MIIKVQNETYITNIGIDYNYYLANKMISNLWQTLQNDNQFSYIKITNLNNKPLDVLKLIA